MNAANRASSWLPLDRLNDGSIFMTKATPTPPQTSLGPLLEPGSIAIVGASPRVGSVGHHLVRQLVKGGFEGRLHLVNPNHSVIEGIECVPDLSAVGAVDLAVLAVADHRLEAQLEAAVDAGAGSAAIFGPCLGRGSTGEPLAVRLGSVAARAGLPICGGNGMGFVNVSRRVRVTGYFQPWDLSPGPVAFISHSGSLFSAMLHNHRHLRFNLVISSGNELATTMDEYVAYALNQPDTRTVGLFLETVREPDGMRSSFEEADRRGIPIVALKVGRTDRARAAVATHSSAIAGDHAAFEAFARSLGVHLVDTPDEMIDTLQVFSSPRRAFPGGVGSVHDSGGERSLFIDAAAAAGVTLSELGPVTKNRIAKVLDPGLEPENPVDAWGSGHGFDAVFEDCLRAVADDDSVGVVVFSVDLTPEENPADAYGGVGATVAADIAKPLVVLSNLASTVDQQDASVLDGAGVPVLRGTATGLAAIRHLLDDRDHRLLPPLTPLHNPHGESANWVGRLSQGSPLTEVESLDLFSDFGIPTIARQLVADEQAAVSAAARIGFPVALKTAGSGVHKSDVDGVLLGLTDADSVAAGYRRLRHLGAEVQVQVMAPAGLEVALGVVRDPQYGLMILVAAGGLLIELLSDYSLMPVPVDETRVWRGLEKLRMRSLFDGYRGRPPADIKAVVGAAVALSHLAVQLGEQLESIDINPLLVHESGCVAVDGLVVPRVSAPDRP